MVAPTRSYTNLSQVISINPVPSISARLKVVDFFTSMENIQAREQLHDFFRQAFEFEIGPSFYQVFGIVSSAENYSLCRKAQILALNGHHGKIDSRQLAAMNPKLDLLHLQTSPRGLFLLRSIRWYLTTSFHLLEWKTEEALNALREVEEIGHDCINDASDSDGYWEIIQFYFAIMPFSKREGLRDFIGAFKGNLPPESKDIVNEQLFNLDTVKMINEVEAVDSKLNPVDALKEREQIIRDRKKRAEFLLEKITGHEEACKLFKEDLKIKVKVSVLNLYMHAYVLGIKLNLREYAILLFKDATTSINPSGIHMEALWAVRKTFVLLDSPEKIIEANDQIRRLAKRIKP